jgi:hypothetical protein
MHRYFQKRFWKSVLRKKKKVWSVSTNELRRKFSTRKIYKFLLWRLTRKEDKARKRRFRIWPKISAGHLWFAIKAPKKPWWIVAGGLALFVIITALPAFFIGYPLLREYKFQRFHKTAKAALAKDDTYTALLTAQTAHLLQPENLHALKTLVEAANVSKHHKLYIWQRILADHPEANFTERSDFLKSTLKQRNLAEAKEWVKQLPSTIPNKEKVYFQCLTLAVQDDDARFNAYLLADDFLQKNPFSSPICEFSWDLCLQSNQKYLFEEAVKEMRSASNLSSPIAFEALRRLLELDTGTDAERKEWARKLWQIKKPSLSDAVLCLNASYGDKRINGISLINALKKDFPELEEKDNKNQIIQLLNRFGRPQTASELLPKDLNSSQHKGTYFNTIQSALIAEENQLAQTLIASTMPSLSFNERRFFDLLITQARPGSSPLNQEQLAKMFTHCSSEELDTIRTFLPFFQSSNFIVCFLEELEKRAPNRLGIKYLLATSYHRLGMHEKLREIVERTDLPEIIQNLEGEMQTCIQKTLYKIDLPSCTSWAELAFSENPQNQSIRYTLALCYLMKKESSNALILLSPNFQNAPPLCPTQRLIGALTLHRNQRFELSQMWAPREHLSLLTDAERKLLKEVITQSQ